MAKKATTVEVSWMIKKFPEQIKNGFIGILKTRGVTVREGLEELIGDKERISNFFHTERVQGIINRRETK